MKHPLLLAAIVFTGLLPVAHAQEGGISISPVRVDLGAAQTAAAITISNGSGEEKLIQVTPTQWLHVEGLEQNAPSRELVVNPPLFRLPAGGSQIVRVGLARQVRAHPKTEKAFRIFFEELPQGSPDSPDATGASQLRILLRIGVPVFVKPQQAANADLHWKISRDAAGKVVLQAANTGTLHERVSSLILKSQKDEATLAQIEGFAYLLPGDTRQWQVQSSSAFPSIVKLQAITEGGAIHVELPLLTR